MTKRKTALIVVDVQNDFLPPNGSLSVGEKGLCIIPVINRLREISMFQDNICLTLDWHFLDHISFAASHTSAQPFTQIRVPNLQPPCSTTTNTTQILSNSTTPSQTSSKSHGASSSSSSTDTRPASSTPAASSSSSSTYLLDLWPQHCVQHSSGAALHPHLHRAPSDHLFVKGVLKDVESYSGFGSSPEDTGLRDFLKDRDVLRVYVVGLCLDYCVGLTALDAAKFGFETYVVREGTASVRPGGDVEGLMVDRLSEAGVKIVEEKDVVVACSE
eukprot:GHVQ01031907.1.p1 GENE.GHVQ01031907.1~~GHVQ01031907.1.p1  ORF type:complete len:273 (-),score=56.93 GHVQ01031907.1:360-1178(-)